MMRVHAQSPLRPPLSSSSIPTGGDHVPPDLRCRYAYKECKYPRSQRKNGKLHSLCEAHRCKANSVQKLYAMKRRNTHDASRARSLPAAATSPTDAPPRTSSIVRVKADPGQTYPPRPQIDNGRVDDDTYLRLVEIKRRIQTAWDRRTFPSCPDPLGTYPATNATTARAFDYHPPSMHAHAGQF